MQFAKQLSFWMMLVFVSTKALSQEKDIELSNITITASLLEQQQKETGRNITTIKGETFYSLPVNSIDELLRYIPGIEVQQRGPQGAQSNIILRGGTFQQVLVIIDGVKLNDPITGHFNSYVPIHPSEIERIEVLKGAASAIYGSEAVGGVINIITKTFAGKISNNKKLRTNLTVGENNLLNAGTHFQYAKNNSSFSAGINTNNAKGEQLRGTTGFFHLTTASIAFSHQFKNNWRASIRAAADFRDFNAQNFFTTFASDTANEKVNSVWSQLNINKKTKNGLLNIDLGYKNLRDQFWFRPASIPNDNRSNLYTAQVYYNWHINKKYSITPGVQFINKKIESNDRGNHSIAHGAFYTIFRQQFAENIFLNESLRLDWDERYGAVLVPQINFAWTPSALTIRSSAGKSIRDADFTERFNNYNKALVTSGTIGNPALKPEESLNFEIGADYHFNKNFQLSTTFFYRDHKGLIDYAPTPYSDMPRKVNLIPTGSYSLAKNVESVKTTGIEIDAVYSKKIAISSILNFMFGYTWLNSKNKDSIPSFYISSHAKHLVNFNVVYTIKSFFISAGGLYKNRNERKAASIGAEITPSYFILNAKLGYLLPNEKGKLFVQADNVFDKKYSDLLGSQMPGKWFSAGIEFNL